MPLPQLTDSGDLPLGVHQASLQETLARFGIGHPQRIAVGERLVRIHRLAALGGEQSMVQYWQVKRGGGQRGIIEIVEDTDV